MREHANSPRRTRPGQASAKIFAAPSAGLMPRAAGEHASHVGGAECRRQGCIGAASHPAKLDVGHRYRRRLHGARDCGQATHGRRGVGCGTESAEYRPAPHPRRTAAAALRRRLGRPTPLSATAITSAGSIGMMRRAVRRVDVSVPDPGCSRRSPGRRPTARDLLPARSCTSTSGSRPSAAAAVRRSRDRLIDARGR